MTTTLTLPENILEQMSVMCVRCGQCNCRGEWFSSRVSKHSVENWDETLYVDPHGTDWCGDCEKDALEWNKLICDHCGLHQDNERHPSPWGGEFCQECYQDECDYADGRDKRFYQRVDKAKKDSVISAGVPIEVKRYRYNNTVKGIYVYSGGKMKERRVYDENNVLRFRVIHDNEGKYLRRTCESIKEN